MEHSFKALIFAPGLPASGSWGSITLRGSGVTVSAGEHRQHAALSLLQVREVGFGKPGVEIAWGERGDAHAAHVLDPAAAAQIRALPFMAELPQMHGLRATQRKRGAGRVVGWSLVGVFVALPLLLLLLLFTQLGRISGWITEQIPIEQEAKLGRASFASLGVRLKLQDSGPAYDAVQSIGKRLTQGSKYSYEFHVVEDATLNAFAMPGGIVVVHTGLIKATKRPEELAGVLAHEVQHVELRHSLQGMVKNLGLRAVWAMVTGDLGGTLAGQAAQQLGSLKFSREAETEADAEGFDALVAQDIDPSGMPAFFRTMSEKAVDAPVAFISSHPLSKDRERMLARRVAELQQKNFTPLKMEAWPPG